MLGRPILCFVVVAVTQGKSQFIFGAVGQDKASVAVSWMSVLEGPLEMVYWGIFPSGPGKPMASGSLGKPIENACSRVPPTE